MKNLNLTVRSSEELRKEVNATAQAGEDVCIDIRGSYYECPSCGNRYADYRSTCRHCGEQITGDDWCQIGDF